MKYHETSQYFPWISDIERSAMCSILFCLVTSRLTVQIKKAWFEKATWLRYSKTWHDIWHQQFFRNQTRNFATTLSSYCSFYAVLTKIHKSAHGKINRNMFAAHWCHVCNSGSCILLLRLICDIFRSTLSISAGPFFASNGRSLYRIALPGGVFASIPNNKAVHKVRFKYNRSIEERSARQAMLVHWYSASRATTNSCLMGVTASETLKCWGLVRNS